MVARHARMKKYNEMLRKRRAGDRLILCRSLCSGDFKISGGAGGDEETSGTHDDGADKIQLSRNIQMMGYNHLQRKSPKHRQPLRPKYLP